jgi:Rps23 Pro-64 3,4-dihydroxylase Tpa1-like proline 4-hydroxylase
MSKVQALAPANGVSKDERTPSPDLKRSKKSSALQEVLTSNVMETESTQQIRQQYQSNTPYSYAQIKNLFQSDFLLSVKEEIKSQTKVNFKESDLFRVYQSIDFANLEPGSELSIQLPNVMKLREVLYSQEWRSFIEKMCGLPPSTLIEKMDCACNCHASGCHLLCHDDVIGTRKVSYIIYLTEQDWKDEEGGSLELYGKQEDEPDSTPIPLARVWPLFNSMAFFVVKPGESFHAVQEVAGERPRLSLQGWYHAAEPPKNMEYATLQQLKATGDNYDATSLQVAFQQEEETEFSDADKKYLSEYLKPEYLAEESLNEIQAKFVNDSSVQLRNFLQDKWVPKLEPRHEKKSANTMEHYKGGVSSEWKLRGPAHKQRFLEYHPQPATTDCQVIGSVLHHIKTKVFESPIFARYLKRLTSLDQPTGVKDGTIRRFRPGLDYTVAHHGLLVQDSVLDATLCFVCDEDEDDKATWEYGDVGGFECYIEADDEDEEGNEAADEYNEEDDTELLSVSASNNTLSLVYRDPGTMRFVKYVGSSAPSSRYDISMEYQLPASEDDDEDEGEGDQQPPESKEDS